MKLSEMTIQCCVCNKIQSDSAWQHGRVANRRMVSHSYCPTCLAHEMQKLNASLPAMRKVSLHAA